MAKAVGVLPGAVRALPRPWRRCQGQWGPGQDCGGTAKGRGGVVKAVGAWAGAVGASPRPWGRAVKVR